MIGVDVASGKSRAGRCNRTSENLPRARRLACAIALAVAGAAQAQVPAEMQRPGTPHHPPDPSLLGADPIGSKLFPPELIMKHQQELGIDQQQRDGILKEIERAHAQIFPTQWQMSAAAEQLSKALEASKLDEGKVLAQAEKVMALEREIKRAHLTLLVRIRNALSDAQRAKAAELRGMAGH